jgi:tRNA (guanine37-N1)-methyltransferase
MDNIHSFGAMISRDLLPGLLPDEKAKGVSFGFQVVGDIAVLSLPPELHDLRFHLAREVLSRHRNIRTVASRAQIPRGDLRVADIEVLAGGGTTTVCREYGFSYRLDIKETFFSPRLASERCRVWMQVKPLEEVIVPFAGVGPFVIPPASRGAIVTAVEKNPAACRFLWENAILNNVWQRVVIHEGDIREILPGLPAKFDRAIVPAPYGYDQVLFSLLPHVREGAMVHFYTFKRASQVPALTKEYEDAGLQVRLVRRCGYVAPGVARYVFDMLKQKSRSSPRQ